MQTIWSRAAQVRCICNCPTCISTTAATLTRRTTTVTARRNVRVGDVFTLFASSLCASVAVVDSKKKDARRAAWDKVIAETREGIHAKDAEQQRRLAALSYEAKGSEQDQEVDGTRAWVSNDGFKSTSAKERLDIGGSGIVSDTWEDVLQWAAAQERARSISGFQDWRGLPLDLLKQLTSEQLGQLLTTPSLLRTFYGGPDCETLIDETLNLNYSGKKLRTLEWSVAKLVLRLLQHAQSPDSSKEAIQRTEEKALPEDKSSGTSPVENGCETGPGGKLSESLTGIYLASQDLRPDIARIQLEERDQALLDERVNYMNGRLTSIVLASDEARSRYWEDFECPPAPRYRDTSKHDRKHLNFLLNYLLRKLNRSDDQRPTMSRICYNLLVTQSAPDVHTYNMLLARFSQLENRALVQAVLNSMLESHIAPNELTHATLLRFFTTTWNKRAFTEYVLRMEGHNRALAVAAPSMKIRTFLKHRYHFFGSYMQKAAIKARLNGEVYESLIVGTLNFYGGQAAMKYYRDMICEGWKPSVDLLIVILKSCCDNVQWEDGLSAWRHLTACASKANTLAYELMLQLCQICGQQTAYDQILQAGIDQGALTPSLMAIHNTRSPTTYSKDGTSQTRLEPSPQILRKVDPSTTAKLSKKIEKINAFDVQKMTDEEYERFKKNKKSVRRDGDVVARAIYKGYKLELNSRLEKQSQQGRRSGNPEHSKSLPSPEGSDVSLLEDDDAICELFDRPISRLDLRSHILHPNSWKTTDEPSTSGGTADEQSLRGRLGAYVAIF